MKTSIIYIVESSRIGWYEREKIAIHGHFIDGFETLDLANKCIDKLIKKLEIDPDIRNIQMKSENPYERVVTYEWHHADGSWWNTHLGFAISERTLTIADSDEDVSSISED